MPYILKILHGPDAGKYVGRKGIRGWDRKAQEDINNACVFKSIQGIKSFFGIRYTEENRLKFRNEWDAMDKTSFSHKEYKKAHSDLIDKYRLHYTERYEAIEVDLQIKYIK